MRARIASIISHIGAGNVLALYSIQFCNYLLPVLIVPLLARALGPEGWGMLAIAQSAGAYVTMAIEYGFDLSASREVAALKEDASGRAELVGGVMGAKFILAVLVTALAIVYQTVSTTGRAQSLLVWSTLLWSLAGGFSVVWYFHGLQRMRTVASLEITGRVIGSVCAVLVARAPGDAWKVLACQATGTIFSSAIAAWLVFRETGVHMPSLAVITGELRRGWAMFLFRISTTLTATGNAVFLGYLAPVTVVGYYAAAEKISRACTGMIYPFSRTIYPVLSQLQRHQPSEARSVARWIAAGMGIAGIAAGLVVFLAAPFLIHILLGPQFAPAVAVLRILSLLLPVTALNMALAYQWVLPLHLEGALAKIVLMSGALNLAIIAALVSSLHESAAAWAVVSAETYSMIAMLVLLAQLPGKSPVVLDVEALAESQAAE